MRLCKREGGERWPPRLTEESLRPGQSGCARLRAEVNKRHLTCILLAASHFAPLITACVIEVHPGHASEDLTGHRAGTWSPGALEPGRRQLFHPRTRHSPRLHLVNSSVLCALRQVTVPLWASLGSKLRASSQGESSASARHCPATPGVLLAVC